MSGNFILLEKGVVMYKTLYAIILTVFLISLLLPASQAQPATPEDLERLVAQCGSCHGMDGNSNNKAMPSFAGISENYFKYAVESYKNGNRKSDLMKSFVANLSPEEIDALAKYYSRQTYKSQEQPYDEDLAQKGMVLHEKYCAKCHDNNGYVDANSFGILAGQGIPYLRTAIKEYFEGVRRVNPIMITKLKRVQNESGDAGFEQLVNFYASVK
jgi:sulfide dehydrogenase cytochrome subunit